MYISIHNVNSDRMIGDHNIEFLRANVVTPAEFPYEVSVVAENLFVPWALAYSEEGKLYVTERSGTIRVIEDDQLIPVPLYTFQAPFSRRGEGGLMGLALDPNFIDNRYIYAMHTYTEGNRSYNRVVRLVEQNDTAVLDTVLIDQIPGAITHNGGRIKIGPDQKLYITTGDAGNADSAQDISSLAGKILRINLDGSIPEDNPIFNSPVYSFGHRNPQGITWGRNNMLYATEHGATARDEINIIQPGVNYGWPIVEGISDTDQIESQDPIIESGNVTWAPAGIEYISHGPLEGELLVANLRSAQLLSFALNEAGTEVEQVRSWLQGRYGRLRDVIQTQDGTIYVTTSNRDGRSDTFAGDDKVLKLTPRS